MKKGIPLSDLILFDPLIDCCGLSGWRGRDNEVRSIFSIDTIGSNADLNSHSDLISPLEGSLVMVDLKKNSLCIEHLNFSAAGFMLYGAFMPRIEPQIIDLAAQKKIPILYSSLIDADDQVRNIYDIILALQATGHFLQFALNSVYAYLKDKDPAKLLFFLQARISNPIFVLNNAFKVNAAYAFSEEFGYQNNHPETERSVHTKFLELLYLQEREQWNNQASLGEKQNVIVLDMDQELTYRLVPLNDQGYLYGFLSIFLQENTLHPTDKIYLDAAKKVILEYLINQRNMDEIEKKHKNNFIHDLLYNNFDSKGEIIHRGKDWGCDLNLPHQLFVIEPAAVESKKNLEELRDKVQMIVCEAVRTPQCRSIIGQIQEQIVLIIPEKMFKDMTINKENCFSLASTLHKSLRTTLPHISIGIGIGRFYPSVMDLSRSFQEAKISLELGKLTYDKNHISHFEDMGIVSLLASIDFLQLDDFYREYLGGLMLHDEQNEGNLLDTLQLYFKHNGEVNVIAQKLYIHPNSLRYRLRKIEELTGTDLKNYEDMLHLFIACKIETMKGQR